MTKKNKPITAEQILRWSEEFDYFPTEGWLAALLNGQITVEEMNKAIRAMRAPEGTYGD